MPIDTYSPCPGGLDKRIKFCCPDLLSEWQKIDRMMEGEQLQACLQHVDRLLEKQGERACLLATKCQLLQAVGDEDQADAVAKVFVEKFPDNPLALAESAFVVAHEQGGRPAMEKILRAFLAAGKQIHFRIYELADMVTRVMAAQGHYYAARALAGALLSLNTDDEELMSFYVRLATSASMPLLLKEEGTPESGPVGAPWKAACDEAFSLVSQLRWIELEERLLALAAEHGDPPVLWRNVATVRGWLADPAGQADALHKYASLDIPWEDAMEAEAQALFLTDDPLGDSQDLHLLSYEAADVEGLQAALASSPYVRAMREDLSPYAGQDGPPPKAGYLLFSGLEPASEEAPDPRSVPRVLARMLLFGRETDRPARLVIRGVPAWDLDGVKKLLGEIAWGLLGPLDLQTIGRLSASRGLLSRFWRMGADPTANQIKQLMERHLEQALLETWTGMPLGCLDGKSPRQAAAEPACRAKVMAGIMLLEHWVEAAQQSFDFNRLRTSLGLPTVDPIEPEGVDLGKLPLVRLRRLVVEKLSDEALIEVYQRAMSQGALKVLERLSREMIDRPGLAGRDEVSQAYRFLASTARKPDLAIQYLDRGRQATDARGQSCAAWDLMELSLRFRLAEVNEINRLIEHIRSRHSREPGVVEALTQMFIDFGLLAPDGTPVAPMRAAGAEPPAIVVPGGEEPGRLWTPDSQRPAGEKSALWTPGMD